MRKEIQLPGQQLPDWYWTRGLHDHRYLLEIIFQTGRGKRKRFAVLFKTAEIERG